MRSGLALSIVFALGCGGLWGPSSPDEVPPPPTSTAFRNADGTYPPTPEGVCQRAHDCGCPEARVVRACVAQAKLGEKVLDGVFDGQERLLRVIADEHGDPVLDAIADQVGMVGELAAAGSEAGYAAMAGAGCAEVCAGLRGE